MPFGFVQQASGGYDGNGSVTLPNPTTAGNRLIIVVGSTAALSIPAGFTRDSSAAITNTYLFSKPTVDGESSWVMNNSTGTEGLEYDAFEISGIDPDVPVDVIPSAQGTAGSTGTTPQSTTYDGLWIGLHRVVLTAGTVPTFGAHTTGEELSDHGHLVGTRALAISTCRKFVQALGTWECDCDPSAGSAVGTIVVYSAEGANREPTVGHFWSFPAEMAGLTSLNLGPNPYWASQVGTPVIAAGGGLRLTGTASAQNVVGAQISGSGVVGLGHNVNIKFKLESLSGDLELATMIDAGVSAAHMVVRYVAASQKIGVKLGSGTEVLSDATVTTGVDYSIDLRTRPLSAGSTTRVTDWQLDYGSGPVAQAQASAAVTANSLTHMTARLGWTAAQTGQVLYRHAICSMISGHYPLTDRWAFPFLKPDTAGTITARTGTTADLRRFTANGTIDGSFDSANIISVLRDWPPTFGASASGAAIITASTGTYTIPMETYDAAANGGSIRTVQALTAFWAASATAATIAVAGHDGSASTTLLAETDPNADTSSTPPWLVKLWRPSGGWTQAKLDAATIDISSADATPDIGSHCLALIAAVRLAEVKQLIGDAAEAAIDPDTAGIVTVTVDAPADQDLTLNWEDKGTPGSTTVPGGTSHTEVLDAADATEVGYVEVVSENEPPPGG